MVFGASTRDSDRESGASEILDEAIDILRNALAAGSVPAAARGLCRAQPSMASIWNAALTAIAAIKDPSRFVQFPAACFSDAAIGHALASADAVVVGADAVTPEWFLDKSGTRMVAAAAAQQGIPLYVVATRDKFVSRALAAGLQMREGDAAEIWEAAPAGVTVRNPNFESTPLDLVATVISDIGLLGPGSIPDVCDATAHDFPPDFLESTKLSK